MGIKFIYGRSGTGKSQECFQEIASKIQEDSKIYIMTPEQFSFTAEKKLMDVITCGAVMNAEVLTFQRMAYRVQQEVGGANTSLTESGKAMLIYHILSQLKGELKFLGKSDENIEMIGSAITEFKKHGITVTQLEQIQNETKNSYLKWKLKDMVLIYKQFQEKLANQFIDENDRLTILAEQLSESHLWDNSIFYLDEFSGFTKQEYEIIRKLAKVAKQINVTVCTDSLLPSTLPETDIFHSNKITANQLIELAKKEKWTMEEPVFLEENHRFKSKELQHLEQNMYEVNYHKYLEPLQDMQLFLANNPYSEIEQVATKIITLVQEKEYRFRDIAIITQNIDTYSGTVKAVFGKYNIPVFMDEKKELNQNILVRFLLALLEIFIRNWSYEAVFNYVKIGLLDLEREEIDTLEKYCLQWGIKGSKWYDKDWDFGIIEPKDQSKLDAINQTRRKMVEPLLKLRETLTKTKEVENITTAIYQFLIDNQIDVRLETKREQLLQRGNIDLANEYATSWKTMMQLFNEIVQVFGKLPIRFDAYSALLKIGLKNSSLGKIPGTQDQVTLGSVDRSRSHKVKAIFIIGLNDGMFPSVHKEEGFLDDADRKELKEEGLELAKDTVERLYEDNFNIYKALTTAEEKLYLSYASSDAEGKALRSSILLSKLKRIFSNLKENSDILSERKEISSKEITFDSLLSCLRALKEGEDIPPVWGWIYAFYAQDNQFKDKLRNTLKGMEYTNVPEKINQENIKQLYGDKLVTSVSQLEKYKSCPFSFYLQYGLQLSSKSNFEIKPLDTGSFMHDILDSFFSYLQENEVEIKMVTEEKMKEILDALVEEKLALKKNYIFTSTAKYRVLVMRLKRVLLKSIKYILESLKESDFKIYKTEAEFKEAKQYDPIKIELKNGTKVEIIGKIDRVDLAQNDEGKYLRIIDYKSSIKDIHLNEVVAGLQIQLLTYLDAISDIEQAIPAGVLYFNLLDPIVKSDRSLTIEEIETEMKKKFKMNGLILADIKVVKMMDHTLEKGASDIVPAYIDAKGELSDSRSQAITKSQFQDLQKHLKKLIKEIAEEITSGKIEVKPCYNVRTKKTPCEYCEYKPICRFNPKENEYQYITNAQKQEILTSIKQE